MLSDTEIAENIAEEFSLRHEGGGKKWRHHFTYGDSLIARMQEYAFRPHPGAPSTMQLIRLQFRSAVRTQEGELVPRGLYTADFEHESGKETNGTVERRILRFWGNPSYDSIFRKLFLPEPVETAGASGEGVPPYDLKARRSSGNGL